MGTLNVSRAAASARSQDLVLISTDKAANPTSVMGATKRLAEMMVVRLFQRSNTRFVALRFGNVLGSRGSLIPFLQKQLLQGGPITVTDPSMERYFMTSTEAVFLILSSLLEGRSGDILVLDMGDPIPLMDIVNAVGRLAGV